MYTTYFPGSATAAGNVSIFSNSVPTMGNVSIGASSNYTYSVANPSIFNTSSNAIQIKGDAEFEGKIKINGQDLVETLETIQRRLAILIPNPKLLAKYEALQQAYDHYKTLEALCIDENSTR